MDSTLIGVIIGGCIAGLVLIIIILYKLFDFCFEYRERIYITSINKETPHPTVHPFTHHFVEYV